MCLIPEEGISLAVCRPSLQALILLLHGQILWNQLNIIVGRFLQGMHMTCNMIASPAVRDCQKENTNHVPAAVSSYFARPTEP